MRTMTGEERIEFAVRFAATNLSHNREGDWLNLEDDLNRFLGAGADDEINVKLSESAYITATPEQGGISGRSPSEQDLHGIQADVQQLLDWYVGLGPAASSKRPRRPFRSIPITLDYRVVRLRHQGRTRGISVIVVAGKLRDCVLAVLLHLLAQQPAIPIELCPECRKVFYRQRRQVFCSRRCTNRAMTNRKRARDREQAAEIQNKRNKK